jgi:hypothetical protein
MYIDVTWVSPKGVHRIVLVAHYLGWIAFDNGVGWHRTKNDSSCANPCALSNRNTLAYHTGCIKTRMSTDENVISSKNNPAAYADIIFYFCTIRNNAVLRNTISANHA